MTEKPYTVVPGTDIIHGTTDVYELYRRLLCAVANGKQRHHKGWTVRILEHLT